MFRRLAILPLARRAASSIVIACAGAIALAACSPTGSDSAEGEVDLRVGDQLRGLHVTMDAAGESKSDGYKITWANFQSGPPIIAAQTGGSIDLGWMAETPLVFAQAAGSPVKVVAVSKVIKPDASPYALVVRADSPIRSVADLKGKSVAYMKGTVLHYMIARLLDDAGLSLRDIKPVQITGGSVALLDNGSADAMTLIEPNLSQLLEQGKIRIIATGAEPVTPGFYYLVASEKALADPRRVVAIKDFIARAARATRWQRENVKAAAPALAAVYKVEPRIAANIIERAPTGFAPIDPAVIAAHQAEADLFHKQGLIRERQDAAKIFDNRFNAVVAKEEAQ